MLPRQAVASGFEESVYRWKADYGGVRTDQARRLKQLETKPGFTQFKRRKLGDPPFGGTSRRGVPECRC